MKTADALKALACAAMEDKEALANLTSINLALSHILTQAQENILVIFQATSGTTSPSKNKNTSHKENITR